MRLVAPTLALALGLAVLTGASPEIRSVGPTGTEEPSFGFGVSEAMAQPARRVARRTARRTTRRTERRQDYLRSLPAGCVWRAPYHFCGGVYYAPRVVDGANVFVVVTP